MEVETPIALAKLYLDIRGVSGYGNIHLAIAIQVCHGCGHSSDALISNALEGPIALTQKHRSEAGPGYDEVGLAVFVEIGHCNGLRIAPDVVVDDGLEAAVALTQKHQNVTRPCVRHSQDRFASYVEGSSTHGNST